MLFNSYSFIFLFLPIVFSGFFLLARTSHASAAVWLALSSIFFYGYWNPAYVALLMSSIVFNYFFGRLLAREYPEKKSGYKKNILILSISTNLALLCYYKYKNFFLYNINALIGADFSINEIILPLGISFFTFTQIAFLVDTYQGKVKEFNFTHYILFVTYFPHLIAGPVLHHKDMMPQFAIPSTYRMNWDHIAAGLLLFTIGLCKKVLWADNLAPYATAVFDSVQHNMDAGTLPTIYEAWSGALAYTLQIYFDFSGYTDMALGISLMFNIRLPINFNSPYKSTSIIDFWRRWHITLSHFLRDYLYIPLGGNRYGQFRRHLNLLATMLLGGLWHGAGWTFVVWGALHGTYLVINHLWRGIPAGTLPCPRLPIWLATFANGALTFIAVIVAWVIFRADNLPQAITMLKAMSGIAAQPITFNEVLHGNLLLHVEMSGSRLAKLVLFGLLWVWLLPNSMRIHLMQGNFAIRFIQIAAVLGILYFSIEQFGSYSPFLYFQF